MKSFSWISNVVEACWASRWTGGNTQTWQSGFAFLTLFNSFFSLIHNVAVETSVLLNILLLLCVLIHSFSCFMFRRFYWVHNNEKNWKNKRRENFSMCGDWNDEPRLATPAPLIRDSLARKKIGFRSLAAEKAEKKRTPIHKAPISNLGWKSIEFLTNFASLSSARTAKDPSSGGK